MQWCGGGLGPSPAKGPVPASAGSARLSRMKDELEWVPPMPHKAGSGPPSHPTVGGHKEETAPCRNTKWHP